LEQVQQRVLRAQAELENYRKRARRELEEQRRYACLPLMRDLLSVVDNLNRAIAAAEQTHNAADLLAGVKMVSEQLDAVLKQHDCQPIEAEGTRFDPHLHEAIAQQPSDEHPPGTVASVTQVGYQLHDRVVRPSQVLVAVAKSKPEE
jgi:molecular chaperone GrpE